jgi:uncharacterized protein (TIGR02284 family)
VTTEEAIHHLNDLIAVAHDGESGYLNAAEHVNDDHFQTVFEQYAKQRAGFVKELQAEVIRLGGEPADSGTLGAAAHRGWLDLKSALTGGGAGAIVAACETGEDSAQAAYERVVNVDISGETRSIVEKQWHKIKEAHQRLVNLKHEHDI